MRFSPRKTVLMACAAMSAATLGLSACGGPGGSAAGEDCDEFTYWSMWKEGEGQQEVLAAAIDDFEADTGKKVDVQWQGRDNLQRVIPTLNTPTVPDLVDGAYVNLYPALVATGQALGLEDAWNADVGGSTVEDLVPARFRKSIDITLEDGQPWMVPYTLSSDAVWFDAAKHPELVDNPPKTWDEFIALLDDLKAKGETPIAQDGDIPKYNSYWLTTLMLRNGGPGAVFEAAEDETGRAWRTEPAVDAAQKVQQLVDGGYFIDGYNGSKFPTQQQRWAQGEAALLFNGTWIPIETRPYAADGFEYASFPFPTTNGEHDSARADFSGFAVPKQATCAGLAQQFAASFLEEKYQEMYADAGQLPLRTDVEPPPEQEAVWRHLADATAFHQENDGVAFPGYNDKVLWTATDGLVLGTTAARGFASSMEQASEDYWERQG